MQRKFKVISWSSVAFRMHVSSRRRIDLSIKCRSPVHSHDLICLFKRGSIRDVLQILIQFLCHRYIKLLFAFTWCEDIFELQADLRLT
jgi:hypothetical protein